MRRILTLSLLGLLLLSVVSAAPQDPTAYATLRAAAEREFAEKSFARAHELYVQASRLELSAEERTWVEFRLADTTLRADAASPNDDVRPRQAARVAIEKLIEARNAVHEAARNAAIDSADIHAPDRGRRNLTRERGGQPFQRPGDELTAEMHEALGDYHLLHPHERNASAAQPHYEAALAWWGSSSDLERARKRYLDIVWRLASDNDGWNVPRHLLVNAASIAVSPGDRARAKYLLAQQYSRSGNLQDLARAIELFEEVIALGPSTPFYDDALFGAASQLATRGNTRVVGPGGEELRDYERALVLFRRLLSEFREGETQYYVPARQAIALIVTPNLDVQVAGTFLPDSEQEVVLSWRNVRQIELALVAVDLTKDLAFDGKRAWTEQIAVAGRPVVRRWTHDTKDSGNHRPGYEAVRLEPRLQPGAYVITASDGGAQTARQLLLVSDTHILTHSGKSRMDVVVSNVITGQPVPSARVHLWQQHGNTFSQREVTTDENGLARLTPGDRNGLVLITAAAGSRQAHHQLYSYFRGDDSRRTDAPWRIYAFTDRPAYRPTETVQWKILARVRNDNRWDTPGDETLEYEITGPRGEKVATGRAVLTKFGSFWGELPLTADMALGVYHVTFKTPGARGERGSAQLFRLEEYKLPEFEVKVVTNKDSSYRLGDRIEAVIEANYYFGGPVANAEVEAVVYQQPYFRHWYPWREYSWYYPPPQMPYDRGTVLTRETLRTDAEGRAIIRIDTPADGTDMTYRIEARVVDSSRREVAGQGEVRVMRHRYTVLAQPEHYMHRPGDSVSIDFKAVDANDKPVRTSGTVVVLRRTQVAPGPQPPPVPMPRGRGMRMPPRPYPAPQFKDEEVQRAKISTDEKGEATFTFTSKKEGHYVIRWTSDEGGTPADVVTAETAVWVADRNTTDLAYHSGSLDLIVDRETIRNGETATVLVTTPASGRWVVISTAADDLLDTHVVKMDGTVKLLQFPVDARHSPNFFVNASSVFDRQLAQDIERIVVPPVEQFLDVDVTTDREQYEPRQSGTVTITTRDSSGKPVQAEVALAVSDEAVTAIQQDMAGDPRQFFYGEQRENPVQISAGLHAQQYLLIEETQAIVDGQGERDSREEKVAGGVVGAAVGGVAADMAMAPPPPPAAPMPVSAMRQSAVAESITVTASAANVAQAEAPVEVQVRSDFRSTAFWKPDIITDVNGTATVKVDFPEALTTWRATARAATPGSQFGIASTTARTNMPLLVRLQAPRFFVVGDRVVVSAVINNNTDAALAVQPSLELEGLKLEGSSQAQTVQVAAHSEGRADWTVVAESLPKPATGADPVTSGRELQPSIAKLTVTARSASLSDAMERALPVYEHGIDKLVARSGKLRGEEALVRLDLPEARRATELTVQIAPSIAVTMLDALPYLIEFPYGCTEQTMSRFLPAAVVANTLEKLQLGRARVAGKQLDAVTTAGIARLFDMQHDDGSWGWWKESSSDPWMTAYVVWGFSIARDAGLRFDSSRIDRAATWLERNLVQREGAIHDQVWMLHALSAWRKAPSDQARKVSEEVWKNRERLSAYSRALFALTAHRWGDAERASVLIRNLQDGVKIDRTPDQSVLLKGETAAETMSTAHWGASGFWWRWHESPVETTAFALQALVTIDPKNALVEPAMNWLVKNRRGSQWNNTRDTAIALLAMNDYLQKSGELAGDVSYELSVNGRAVASKTLSARDVLGAPSRFTIPAEAIAAGKQEIRIRRTSGTSPLYFSAEARFVSLEEPVKAAGNELFVRRQYYRLAPRPTLLEGVQYDKVPLRDQERVASGERVEVVVTLETKNDYEYLLFEDLKPAGFEAVELQSGNSLYARNTKTNASASVYQELRDRKVAMFVDRLGQGLWEIRYTLRAEVPGTFHALPLLGQAMYVPDVRANGDEVRVTVEERAN
jgi:alpha-2-macroglobulin